MQKRRRLNIKTSLSTLPPLLSLSLTSWYFSFNCYFLCFGQLPGDSSYASLVKSKQEDCISESSVAASPLLQHDDERHDQLPTYVNARSANYANV